MFLVRFGVFSWIFLVTLAFFLDFPYPFYPATRLVIEFGLCLNDDDLCSSLWTLESCLNDMAPAPCIVHLCKNIGTHHFPKDEVRKAMWIQAITHIKPGLTVRPHSLICSAHFQPTDFAFTPTCLTKLDRAAKFLKKNAVPSLFAWAPVADDQQQASSSQSLSFDPTKVTSTYSRSPQIQFVEELPFIDTETNVNQEDPLKLHNEDLDEDPLQTYCHYNCETNCFPNEFIAPENYSVETEICINNENPQEHTVIGIMNENPEELPLKANKHDKEIQTEKISLLGFTVYHYQYDNKCIHFYTGLENYEKLSLVFRSLGKSASNLKYFYDKPPSHIDAFEQFFITLIILRRHKTFENITMLYKITSKNVYSIFITWIRFMALQWKDLNLWIDKECTKAYMPLDFQDEYPATRTVLDATECPVKKPKLPLAQQITFSSYKNRNTVKFVIGITPSGLISYVSPCYGGSATDRQIIERSDILEKFDYNDEIMGDKGLNVQDIFLPYGVKVNMPAFFKKGNQISSDTMKSNRKVASKRVHIERVIGMLKTYKILREPMNQTETLLSSDIVFVCAMLVNFRMNIMNKKSV